MLPYSDLQGEESPVKRAVLQGASPMESSGRMRILQYHRHKLNGWGGRHHSGFHRAGADIFEIGYGETRERVVDNSTYRFSLTDIKDDNEACYLMDFPGNEAMNAVRTHAILDVVTDRDEYRQQVSSRTCGAYTYTNDSTEIRELLGLLEKWSSISSAYFKQEFIHGLGEGARLKDSPLSIFMAECHHRPRLAENDYLSYKEFKEEYRFIFIVTRSKN